MQRIQGARFKIGIVVAVADDDGSVGWSDDVLLEKRQNEFEIPFFVLFGGCRVEIHNKVDWFAVEHRFELWQDRERIERIIGVCIGARGKQEVGEAVLQFWVC